MVEKKSAKEKVPEKETSEKEEKSSEKEDTEAEELPETKSKKSMKNKFDEGSMKEKLKAIESEFNKKSKK